MIGCVFMNLRKKLLAPIEKIKKVAQRSIPAPKFVGCFLGGMVGFLLVWTLLVFVLDPYIYYHRAWGLKNVFNNSRARVPGVMRNFEYDTVLFGTSMCQNFKCSEIDSIWQAKSIKATSAGLTSTEFSKYFNTALRYRKDKFKLCIMGVDIWSFSKKEMPGKRSYQYLYEDRVFPVEYFYSADTASAMLDMIVTNIEANYDHIAQHELNEDVMFSNKPRYKFNRANLEKDVRKIKQTPANPNADTIKHFDEHLFTHVRNNPDIQFEMFLPPYSIYFWCFLRESGVLEDHLAARDKFACMAAQYPNVKLHDFQADFDIACGLDHYKDITHYSPAVNTRILQDMKAGKNVFSLEEFQQRTNLLRQRSAEYQAEFDKLRQSGKK